MRLLDAFHSAGIPVAGPGDPHYRNGWINTPCPFCHSQKNHLGITENCSRANCYKCGPKHPKQVIRVLLGSAAPDFIALRYGNEQQEKEHLFGKYSPPPGVMDLRDVDVNTLSKSRNWSPEFVHSVAALYGLKSYFYPGEPTGIFIPIRDADGRNISWTIRFHQPLGAQRYRTASDQQKVYPEKHLLFGEDICRARGMNTIIVVEGPFDVMRIGAGTCGTLGTGVTRQQVDRISRYPKRVICFDNSDAAQQVADRLCFELSCAPGLTERVILDSEDPGSATDEQVRELKEYVGI